MSGSADNIVPERRSVGVLEYWSVGVVDVIQTELYKSRFRQNSAMIICSVNVIGQNKFRQVCKNHFDHPNMLGNVFPILHNSITPVLLR